MSNGNQRDKFKKAFIESRLSVKDATDAIKEADKEENERRAKEAYRDFRSGLFLRNTMAFFFLIILFMLLVQNA